MTRTPLLRRAAATVTTLLLVGTLAACGDDEPTATPTEETTSATPSPSPEEPSESEEPADAGDRIQGEGYSYGMPEGWQDGTERFRGMSPLMDTGAFDSQASGGFADNVNVIRNQDYPEMGLDEAERTFAEEAGQVSENVRINDRSEIGGETALHLSGTTPVGEQRVRTEQYSLYRDGAWYIVTFSFGQDTEEGAADADIAAVLDSWEWS